MSQSVSLNSSILAALNQLSQINQSLATTSLSLSTGLILNRAADDPSGLIASTQLQAALAVLEAQSEMLQSADTAAATADDALGQAASLLTEANGIAVQLAGGGLSEAETDALQLELDSILEAVDSLGVSTEFGDEALLDGSASLSVYGESLDLIALDSDTLGEVEIDSETYTLADIGSGGALADDPEAMQQVIAAALSEVTTAQGEIGAFQTDMIEPLLNITTTSIEELTAANSAITDTDYAAATAQFAQLTLLSNASLLTLSILLANNESVLSLLSS